MTTRPSLGRRYWRALTGAPQDGGRCAHCGRRLRGSVHSNLHDDGSSTAYCGQRAACRRACHEEYGQQLPTSGASTEAFGAALIAGDYVPWPWWAHLLPGSARDEMRDRFAKVMAAAVEDEVRRRAAHLSGAGGEEAPHGPR